MRGLIVLFLLVFWPSSALPATPQEEPVRLAQHAPVEDSGAAGHALDSGPIAAEDEGGEADGGSEQCAGVEGVLGYYACQARAAVSGSLQAIVLPLLALLLLLTLSMVLLWF
jgi:hypothetical protein